MMDDADSSLGNEDISRRTPNDAEDRVRGLYNSCRPQGGLAWDALPSHLQGIMVACYLRGRDDAMLGMDGTHKGDGGTHGRTT